jgi:hypothetical protein
LPQSTPLLGIFRLVRSLLDELEELLGRVLVRPLTHRASSALEQSNPEEVAELLGRGTDARDVRRERLREREEGAVDERTLEPRRCRQIVVVELVLAVDLRLSDRFENGQLDGLPRLVYGDAAEPSALGHARSAVMGAQSSPLAHTS